jgi:hypothetical protein
MTTVLDLGLAEALTNMAWFDFEGWFDSLTPPECDAENSVVASPGLSEE